MAKYKILKAAAHNFAESFFGPLNPFSSAPVIEWFAWIAMRTGEQTAEIEFLTGQVEPEAFHLPDIVQAVRGYRELLPDFLGRSGCPIERVRRVTVRLRFEGHMLHMGDIRVRYLRESEIEDERGKVWQGKPFLASTHFTCVEECIERRRRESREQPEV